MNEDKAKKTLEKRELAHRAAPSASTANSLAWFLLMAPSSLRDDTRALELAEQSFSQKVGSKSLVRNTLGMAYYRVGKFEQAIATLNDNLVESGDRDLPLDLFVLSLSHAGLGDLVSARNYFQLGDRWMRNPTEQVRISQRKSMELKSIRESAAAALNALESTSDAK